MRLKLAQMKAGPDRGATPSKLHEEYNLHLNMARHYLRKALEAEAAEAPGASALFQKAQIEQNAALLCQSESHTIMLGFIIHSLVAEEVEAGECAVQ